MDSQYGAFYFDYPILSNSLNIGKNFNKYMIDIKVNLTITLPGRVMISEVEYLKKTHKKRVFKTGKTKDAKQVIKLSKEAYNFMTSNYYPVNFKSKNWYQMSKKARLETHLKEIAEALGGKMQSYQIFED